VKLVKIFSNLHKFNKIYKNLMKIYVGSLPTAGRPLFIINKKNIQRKYKVKLNNPLIEKNLSGSGELN
jgi:hypothetical protein